MSYRLTIEYSDGTSRVLKEPFDTKLKAIEWLALEGDHVVGYDLEYVEDGTDRS